MTNEISTVDKADACDFCGESTVPGSGNWVNRIPSDIGWQCHQCQLLECERCGYETDDFFLDSNILCLDCHSMSFFVEGLLESRPKSISLRQAIDFIKVEMLIPIDAEFDCRYNEDGSNYSDVWDDYAFIKQKEALHSRLALVEFWSCFVQVHELSGPVDDQMVTHDELDLETLDPAVALFVTEFGKLWDSMEQKEGT